MDFGYKILTDEEFNEDVADILSRCEQHASEPPLEPPEDITPDSLPAPVLALPSPTADRRSSDRLSEEDEAERAVLLSRIKHDLDLELPHEVLPTHTLHEVTRVLISQKWLNDEQAMRNVMLIVLQALDPECEVHRPEILARANLGDLANIFLSELWKTGRSRLAQTLQQQRPRTSNRPPSSRR